MTINIYDAYQGKKTVYIYLDTNEEIKKLKAEVGANILLHTETWQKWGKKPINDAWDNKTADYIIWPHQTTRHERWVLLVINVKEGKTAVHTASQTADAKQEEQEIINYLAELNGLKGKPNIDTDDGSEARTDAESAYLTILYVKETLKAIKAGNYNYDLDNSDYDLAPVKKEYDQLTAEIAKLKTIKEIEENQEKHTEKDLEKHKDADLLTDDQKKTLKEYEGLKEDRDDFKNKYENEQKETAKLKEEKKELLKLGTEQAQKITKLEEDNENLKKQLTAKPTPAPTPNTGGNTTPPPAPAIAGTEEWIATAKFLTEPNFGKAMQYFKELYNKQWTSAQRHAIFHILKANNDNWNWAEGKWGRRFDI